MTRILIASLFALLALPAAAQAEDEDAVELASTGDALDCVRLPSVDRTEVIDDRNILFFMRDGSVYRNRLPNDCPTLEFEDSFMYRTTLNRLCDLDTITVLRDMGFGFGSGPTCGLGKFQPVSPEAAKAVLENVD